MWKPPAKEQLNATHSRMQPGGWQVCCAVQWQAKRLALVFFSLTGAKKREGNTGRESWVKQREGSSYCWMCATETNYVLLTVTIVIPKSLNKSQAERLPSWKCSLPLNSWPRLEGEGSTQQRIWGKGEENLVTRIPEKTPSFALKKKKPKQKRIADSLQIFYSQQSGQHSENANPTDSSDKQPKQNLSDASDKSPLHSVRAGFYPSVWNLSGLGPLLSWGCYGCCLQRKLP